MSTCNSSISVLFWVMVCANPHASGRKGLWEDLDKINVTSPWVLIGDLNCVLKDDERNSSSGASSCFVEWVERKGLIALGYSGPRFMAARRECFNKKGGEVR